MAKRQLEGLDSIIKYKGYLTMKDLITTRMRLNDVLEGKALEAIQSKYKVDKDTEYIRKGIIPDDMQFADKERATIDYITTNTPDRDKDIVLPKGGDLSHYTKHPVVLWCHKADELPVGKNMWIKLDDKGLIAKTEYAKHEQADKIYKYLKDKFPLANSIGFIPKSVITNKDFDKLDLKLLGLTSININDAERIFDKWLLLEYSKVPVPANQEALQIAISKGLLIPHIKYYDYLNITLGNADDYVWKTTFDTATIIDKCNNCKPDAFNAKQNDNNAENFKYCICKGCGYYEEHKAGLSCQEKECPKCKAPLMGSNNIPDGIKPKDDSKDITKPGWEQTKGTFRYRLKDPSLFQDGSFRTIAIKRDKPRVNSIMGKLRNQTTMTIQSLLFPKADGWNLADAKKWYSEHSDSLKDNKYHNFKMRINKQLPKAFNKTFTIEQYPDSPRDALTAIYGKYLECPIKGVYLNSYIIPCALIGSYLAGLKYILTDEQIYALKDSRNFTYDGKEKPLIYDTIRLKLHLTEDFLIEGESYYQENKKNIKFIIKLESGWYGEELTIISAFEHREFNKQLFEQLHSWVKDNNLLKNEKFSLTGEFLDINEITFEDVILTENNSKVIQNILNKYSKSKKGKGMIFMGNPGTGKTMTGKAIKDQTKHTFIWVSSKDFMKIGSTRGLALSFKLARDLAPTILFMEDIDDSGIYNNIDLLKTELDGMQPNKGILTILTTNYPEFLPDALLDRPGRFDEVLSFSLPDEKLIEQMLNKWIGEIDKKCIDELVKELNGYSGAHIKQLTDHAWDLFYEDNSLDIEDALKQSLSKTKKQRELISAIRNDDNLAKEMTNMITKDLDVIEKSGRIISSKNMAKLKAAYEALAEVIKIAGGLDAEPEQADIEDNGNKDQKNNQMLSAVTKIISEHKKDNANNIEISDDMTDVVNKLTDLLKTKTEEDSIKKQTDDNIDIDIKDIQNVMDKAFDKFSNEVEQAKKEACSKMELRLLKATGRVSI